MILTKHLAVLFGLLVMAAAQPSFAQGLRIDQLNAAGSLSDIDLVPIEQGGEPPAKKMTLGALKGYLGVLPPGFYVATNGSDSNDGTAPTTGGGHGPFATLTKCQSAMQGSSTKTCYVRAGTYTPAAVSTCWWGNGASTDTCAIQLTTADNGEAWEEYPPDGCTTAIINAQSTADGNGLWAIFSGKNYNGSGTNGVTNLTINCMTLENFQFAGFTVYSNPSAPSVITLTNNIIKNSTGKTSVAAQTGGIAGGNAINCVNCSNLTLSHNAIMNIQEAGTRVTAWASVPGASISGLTISGNFVSNTCLNVTDCGGIYQQDGAYTSTNISITNNYVRDGNPYITGSGGGAIGAGIYLDDCLSNATVSGNIITGMSGGATTLIHGGNNDVYSGNIIDLTSYGRQLTTYLTSFACEGLGGAASPMTGNSYVGNVVIGEGGGGGYFGGTITGAAMPTIGGAGTGQANDYYNYGGSAISSLGIYGASQLTVNDTNPQNVNPQFSGCYVIGSGSGVLSSSINFPPIVGGWGPPGFTIPPAIGGSVPSYPSPTC